MSIFIRPLLPFAQIIRLAKIDSHQLVSKYLVSQAGDLEVKSGWAKYPVIHLPADPGPPGVGDLAGRGAAFQVLRSNND